MCAFLAAVLIMISPLLIPPSRFGNAGSCWDKVSRMNSQTCCFWKCCGRQLMRQRTKTRQVHWRSLYIWWCCGLECSCWIQTHLKYWECQEFQSWYNVFRYLDALRYPLNHSARTRTGVHWNDQCIHSRQWCHSGWLKWWDFAVESRTCSCHPT